MQHEAPIGLHRSAAQDGLPGEPEVLRAQPQLLEDVAEVHRQRTVDHNAERTFRSVLADERHGLGEIRIGHAGHGDQELIAQVTVRHRS